MHITGTLTAAFTNLPDFNKILGDLSGSPVFTVQSSDDQALTINVSVDMQAPVAPAAP